MAIARPYQARLVGKSVKALTERLNTLAIAPTGAGKTYMMAMLSKEFKGKHLVLQHRDELVGQNLKKYRIVNPRRSVGLFTAQAKSWRAQTTFAMVQTLVRNLGGRLPKIDLCLLDEAHHVPAPTYQQIIQALREQNPDMMLAGFTATPQRGDKKSLRCSFDNISDQITIGELIALGYLHKPVAYIIDINHSQEQLQKLGKISAAEQYDVDAVLNRKVVTDEVIKHWKEKAGNRQTVMFCSTVAHAQAVTEALVREGVAAECVHGGLHEMERRAILQRLDSLETQVVVNVNVLTEGFDSPPVACVVLLRHCSEKGPLIQMIGRGLRIVDPIEYPGVVKKDCVVLDFGISIMTHGDLEQLDGLHEERESEPGQAIKKKCPTEWQETYRFPDADGNKGCGAEIPAQTRTCPFCGFQFERMDGGDDSVHRVELTEIDLFNASPFRWVNLWGSDFMLMASGFNAWVGVFSADQGETFHALGKVKKQPMKRLAVSDRLRCISRADDFLREHETDSSAKKSKRWLNDPASENQINMLNRFGYGLQYTPSVFGGGMNKYAASCHMDFQYNRAKIEQAIGVYQ